jgi:hypothetical protein
LRTIAQRTPHGGVLGLPPAIFQAAHCLAQGGQKKINFQTISNFESQCDSDWKAQNTIGH